MGKPKAPTPPDPKETASAQTGTNIGTAIANSYLGNINQQTPDGSLTYKQTGTQKWKDPISGKVYDIPTTTAIQTLSQTQQQLKNKNDATSLNLADLAKNQSSRLGDLLNTPFSLGGAPAAGDAANLQTPNYTQFANGPQLQTQVGNTGQVKSSIDGAGAVTRDIADAGAITKSYGTDYGSNVKEVQDALYARINPALEQGRTALETKLANQGIQVGSAAYEAAMKSQGQQENDARYGAILNAGQEQSRLADLEARKAGFENAAQAQQYSQNANNASFSNAGQAQQFGQNAAQTEVNNSAQQQAYQQALASGQFSNDALQQMFGNQNQTTAGNNALQDQSFNADQAKINAQNAQRSQYLNEQYALRNQPINEISGLLNGAQVQSPNFVPTQGQSIPTVDYAGLTQQNYANQMGAYNSQQAQSQSLMGGLFGLGSAFIRSDERTKEDIKKVGEIEGNNIYRFRYKEGGPMQLGVMAQEVEKDHPEVVREFDGVKHVQYGKLFRLGEAA
jgi:hypothetical protein